MLHQDLIPYRSADNCAIVNVYIGLHCIQIFILQFVAAFVFLGWVCRRSLRESFGQCWTSSGSAWLLSIPLQISGYKSICDTFGILALNLLFAFIKEVFLVLLLLFFGICITPIPDHSLVGLNMICWIFQFTEASSFGCSIKAVAYTSYNWWSPFCKSTWYTRDHENLLMLKWHNFVS